MIIAGLLSWVRILATRWGNGAMAAATAGKLSWLPWAAKEKGVAPHHDSQRFLSCFSSKKICLQIPLTILWRPWHCVCPLWGFIGEMGESWLTDGRINVRGVRPDQYGCILLTACTIWWRARLKVLCDSSFIATLLWPSICTNEVNL